MTHSSRCYAPISAQRSAKNSTFRTRGRSGGASQASSPVFRHAVACRQRRSANFSARFFLEFPVSDPRAPAAFFIHAADTDRSVRRTLGVHMSSAPSFSCKPELHPSDEVKAPMGAGL